MASQKIHPKYVSPNPRVPPRNGMTDPSISWRFGGPPNYEVVNETYLKEKLYKHKPGSLEYIVESLVKTLEMEASHKMKLEEWVSIASEEFRYTVNGGPAHSAQQIIDRGTYNIFLDRCPVYKEIQRDESEDRFKEAFPRGFAWEVEKVLVGPPMVIFTWHHWSTYEGKFEDHEPTGEKLQMRGTGFATVNEDIKLLKLELFFDPNPLIMKLKHIAPGSLADVRPN